MDKSSLILYLRHSTNSPFANTTEMHEERIELQAVPSITLSQSVHPPLTNTDTSINTDEYKDHAPTLITVTAEHCVAKSRPSIITTEGRDSMISTLQEGVSCVSIVDELNPLQAGPRKSRHRSKDAKRRHRRHRRSKGLKSDTTGGSVNIELIEGVNIDQATRDGKGSKMKSSRNLRKTHRGIDETTAELIKRDSLGRATVTSATTDGLPGVVAGDHPIGGDLTKKKSPLVEMIVAGLIMLAGTGTLLMSVVLGGDVGTIVGSSCMGVGLLLMIIGVCWYLSKTQDTQDREGRLDVRVIDARLLADLIKRGVQVRQV